MDNIILGLLLLTNRTIYELRERIDKGLYLMYSSSMGSIQAAVKKLLRAGYIQYEESVENGKYKKIYSITDSGRMYFSEWVNAPMNAQNIKNPELARIYFMGFSDRQKRSVSIRAYLADLEKLYGILQMICEEADESEVPEAYRDVFRYQFATARYGRDLMKFNIEWYEKLLTEMEAWK